MPVLQRVLETREKIGQSSVTESWANGLAQRLAVKEIACRGCSQQEDIWQVCSNHV